MSGGAAAPRDFHRRWPTLLPPLRPHAEVAARIAALLPDDPRLVLLLGVTPELARVAPRVIGMDWSAAMAATAWPGGPLVLADWRTLPLADGSVCAVIGDGSLSMLRVPDDLPGLFERLRAVTGEGRAILRCFTTPESAEHVAELREEALAGALSFHEFKMRFNMAVAEGGNVTSARLFEAFADCFPDRAALSAVSGWCTATIAEIDQYEGSAYLHCYPSRAVLETLAAPFGTVRFEVSGDYPGASFCPLLVIDFA